MSILLEMKKGEHQLVYKTYNRTATKVNKNTNYRGPKYKEILSTPDFGKESASILASLPNSRRDVSHRTWISVNMKCILRQAIQWHYKYRYPNLMLINMEHILQYRRHHRANDHSKPMELRCYTRMMMETEDLLDTMTNSIHLVPQIL